MDSILTSVKRLIGGIPAAIEHFDDALVMQINMVFSILTQMGVGPSEGFHITGATEEWSNFIEDLSKIEMVKEYVALKVGMVFDPPTSSIAKEAKENYIKELEYRLYIQFDSQGGFAS